METLSFQSAHHTKKETAQDDEHGGDRNEKGGECASTDGSSGESWDMGDAALPDDRNARVIASVEEEVDELDND